MGETTRRYTKASRRFGEVAIELGFCTEAHLTEALAIQAKERASSERRRLLGEILYELDRLTRAQVDAVLAKLIATMGPISSSPQG